MVKIGMMIGQRYEIVEKIGTGGMSDVYKAKCHKLQRYVAVKVLKQEFAENENFVSKFQVEAQAAAGLMHPNIVNVYDVGEDNGIHYIVMELVEGITLKKYIERKAGLSFKEAVSIAIQVCMGIEKAHNHHIIHRDIKPQNIIISKDGKVKVTDFGIAKAATSNTISSNVMGSVHYTSPEQARGGYSDEKSDIYSLGITLFEMLTGRVPFNGDTTVAIAIKHIQEPMPSPREFAEGVPVSVEAIVLKCCQKSPDRRYQSILEVMQDLKQAMVTPDENFVVSDDPDVESGTKMVSAEELEEIKKKSSDSDYGMRLNETYREETEREENKENNTADRKDKIATIVMVLLGIFILVIIFALLFLLKDTFGEGAQGENDSSVEGVKNPSTIEQLPLESEEGEDTVVMINVVDMDVQTAAPKLREMGLIVHFENQNSEVYEEGKVISSNIPENTVIQKGSTVVLTVSSGSNSIEVLDVVGISFEDAKKKLVDQGFKVIRYESASSEVASGYVILQSPNGGQPLKKGESVALTVSVGLPGNQVVMPQLLGMSEMEASMELSKYGLSLGESRYVSSNEYPSGVICYQSVESGQVVEKGDKIDIAISSGPQASSYKYNGFFSAPTATEAPEYVAGTEVLLTLVADDGKVLMEMETTSFPQTQNFFGIGSSGGTLTFTYQVTKEGNTLIDPQSGEVTTLPGETVKKSFSRRIDFVKE